MLYLYFEFNVYSFKGFVTHIFWGQICSKNWSSSNSLKFCARVHCYMLITILMFTFTKFLSFMFFGPIWSHVWISPNWLRGTLLYDYYGFNVYVFKILFIHISWANLVPRNMNEAQVFSCEFCKISENTFNTKHVCATASVFCVGYYLVTDLYCYCNRKLCYVSQKTRWNTRDSYLELMLFI